MRLQVSLLTASLFFFPALAGCARSESGSIDSTAERRTGDASTAKESGPRDGVFAANRSARPAMTWVASPHFRRAEGGPRTAAEVDAIVLHTTEGRYDEAESFEVNQARNYAGVVRYFQNNDRQVSAHFVIGPAGEITQMVDVGDIAHTQTYYNARSIGIECAGWSDRPETWTPAMLESLVELVSWLAVEWEVPLERPEGDAYSGPWSIVDPVAYEELLAEAVAAAAADELEAADAPVIGDGSPDDARPTIGTGGFDADPSPTTGASTTGALSIDDRPARRFNGAGLVGHYQIQPWNRTDPGPYFPWAWFEAQVRRRVERP
ncbi:MAG: N-acetylmuramoyl-L-alanine amidase [Phycisphaerales bacterium]